MKPSGMPYFMEGLSKFVAEKRKPICTYDIDDPNIVIVRYNEVEEAPPLVTTRKRYRTGRNPDK